MDHRDIGNIPRSPRPIRRVRQSDRSSPHGAGPPPSRSAPATAAYGFPHSGAALRAAPANTSTPDPPKVRLHRPVYSDGAPKVAAPAPSPDRTAIAAAGRANAARAVVGRRPGDGQPDHLHGHGGSRPNQARGGSSGQRTAQPTRRGTHPTGPEWLHESPTKRPLSPSPSDTSGPSGTCGDTSAPTSATPPT